MAGDGGEYAEWIGNTESAHDLVTAASMAGMNATLDRDEGAPETGTVLPALWHWMYFAPRAPWSGLGLDGHPQRGGFIPPVALPRRMFAGAQYRFKRSLAVGDEIRREGVIRDVTAKQGRSGELVFVRVGYTVHGPHGVAFEEDHDIVYRGEAGGETRRVDGKEEGGPVPDWRQTITPDPVLLFRYSALTFNGHRIHYDRTYAMEQEGYPGLVVHGPLIATLLLELVRNNSGDRSLATFNFRAKRPLFDTEPFDLIGGFDGSGGFWANAFDPAGRTAMETDGTFAVRGA